jgi:integrase
MLDDVFIDLAQGNGGRSRANYHYIYKNFFKWARKRSYITYDPMEDRPAPTFTVTERRRLPVTMFPTLLDQAGGPRNRILFAGAIYLLVRSIELTRIRIADVNLEQGRIRVNLAKKTGRYDVATDLMPITSELDAELRHWLIQYQDMCGYLDTSWYLFPAFTPARAQKGHWGAVSGTGLPRPDRMVAETHKLANEALDRINWKLQGERGEGMHTLRRAGARARFDVLKALGYDGALRQVQSLLHHKNAAMTEHYIGIDLDKFIRDEQLIGKPMYPQLSNPELVNLAEHRVDRYRPEDWETALPGFKVRRAA